MPWFLISADDVTLIQALLGFVASKAEDEKQPVEARYLATYARSAPQTLDDGLHKTLAVPADHQTDAA